MKFMSKATRTLALVLPVIFPVASMADGVSDNSAEGPTAVASVNEQRVAESAPRVLQLYTSDKTAELSIERAGSALGLNSSRSSMSFLFNEERDNVLTASVLYDVDWVTTAGMRLSFGTRVYAGLLSIENADVFGIGANIEAGYVLPLEKFPLALTAGLGYAPDILTFGQADRIFDWNVRAGLPLTSSVDAFVGIRFLQFDTRPGDRELDDQIHIGFRWTM